MPVTGRDGSPDFQATFTAAGRTAARFTGDLAGIDPAIDPGRSVRVNNMVRVQRALLDDGSNVSDSIIHSNQFCFMLYPSDPEIYTAS